MATARPFAYNPGGSISGTTQVGDLTVGTPTSGFTSSPQFWNGPDEDLGYVIAIPVSGNTQPTEISGVTASIGFYRTDGFVNGEFLQLAEIVSNEFGDPQTFTSASDASDWLTSNGFWNSFIPVYVTPTNTPTPTTTPTPSVTMTQTNTPTPTSTQAAGLLIDLDSGNLTSYPGTGSTWYDLAGTANNATLFNSPTYSSSYDGILQFDDVSLEYGTIPNIGSLSNWTVEVWFRLTTSLVGKVTSIVSNQYNNTVLNYSIGTNNMPSNSNLAVGFYDINNGGWKSTTGVVPVVGNWYQVVGTYDGSTIRQYVNGVASGGTFTTSVAPQSGGEIRMMRRWDETLTSNNLTDGDLAIVKIYNTVLSSSDILQSYNNTYTRFLEPTPTPTTTPTQTQTPSVTPTQTPTNTVTATNTSTPTPSITATQTPTPTNTSTVTRTPTNTPTTTPTPTRPAYLYYRWQITQTRVTPPNADAVQAAEFVFQIGGVDQSMAGVTVTNPGGNNPSGETPSNLVDNNLTTKVVDLNFVSNGNISNFIFQFSSAKSFNGYRWATANDFDDRDPRSWTVAGSNNGTTWTTLSTVSNYTATTARDTWQTAQTY